MIGSSWGSSPEIQGACLSLQLRGWGCGLHQQEKAVSSHVAEFGVAGPVQSPSLHNNPAHKSRVNLKAENSLGSEVAHQLASLRRVAPKPLICDI